jgi:replication-associated recombination protein RarA
MAKKSEIFSGQWIDTMRPTMLSDFITSKRVGSQINSALNGAKPPNTILISGLTGSGKTTLARIIAAHLTGLTDLYEASRLSTNRFIFPSDVSETNCGAEEGSIEEVRNMIQSANFKPKSLPRRIFILDEVHLLSGKALSSLLKPLEEPISTTTWILCTNYPEKLKPEMKSRAVHITLAEMNRDDSLLLLAKISKKTRVADVIKANNAKEMIREVAEWAVDQHVNRLPRFMVASFQAGLSMVAEAVDHKEAKAFVKELKKSSFAGGNLEIGAFLDGLEHGSPTDNAPVLLQQAVYPDAFPELFNAIRRRVESGKFTPMVARMFAWCIDANGWAVHNGMRPLEYVAARYLEYFYKDGEG